MSDNKPAAGAPAAQLAPLPATGAPPEPAEPAAPAVPAPQPEKTHKVSEWKHGRRLLACRFDRQQRFVFTGALDNNVVRWALPAGTKTELAGHESWVRSIAPLADGATLVTGGYDGRLIWWPLADEKPKPARTVEAHQGWIRAVAVSPDGQQIATCGNDLLVKLWSAADGSLLRTLAGHERHVYNVAFHPAGGHLVSVDLMGIAKHWSTSDGAELRQFDAAALHIYDKTFRADIGGARSIAFTPDGKYLACGGITEVTNAFAGQGKPVVVLFDWEKTEPKAKLTLKDKFVGTTRGLACHANGLIIAGIGGHGGGVLAFFRPDQANEVFKFKAPNQIHDIDLAPDGLTLAAAHEDGALRIYSMTEKTA